MLAVAAARRPVLVKALNDQTAARSRCRMTNVRDRAERSLCDAARAAVDAGDDSQTLQELVAALEEWQVTYEAQLSAAANAQSDWAQLQAVLDGDTLNAVTATDATVTERDALVAGAEAAFEAAVHAELSAIEAAPVGGGRRRPRATWEPVTELVTAARQTVKASREQMLTAAGLAEKADGVADEHAGCSAKCPRSRRSRGRGRG